MSARGKARERAPGREAGRALEGDGIGVDEAAVIARVRAGEPEAYAELVRAFTGVALRAAAALGAGADAEDVVQQSFFKAYRALGRFQDGAAFRPWLLAIVANETRNTVRSAARRRSVVGREALFAEAEPLIPESADPAVAALDRERRTVLLSALDRLSEPHRLVVTYRYLLDMDEAETAQALGWPRGTVKSRLSRALRKLERLLPGAECGGTGRAGREREEYQGREGYEGREGGGRRGW
ncbi:RNA polymerase sigma factor [Streptomyces sp. G45]|uniref:RNA polymerase sigma factor n=1 Tax=Streptomyces sp. G45 TaxID=3406627 RepID=UPI003C2664F3